MFVYLPILFKVNIIKCYTLLLEIKLPPTNYTSIAIIYRFITSFIIIAMKNVDFPIYFLN